jgi:putative NADH-flavin reductase
VKLLALGATGRTGRFVVQYALDSGYDVVALVRNPAKIAASSSKLSIITGTPENAGDVEAAIKGCDAVISTLDNNRSSDLPWAKPVSPPAFMKQSISHTVNAMRTRGIRRIVVVSALGAGDSFPYAPFITRVLARRTNLRLSYADHEAQEEVLKNSELDWTCVRPAILTNGTSLKPLVVSYEGRPKPALTITRVLVARFLVDIVTKPEFFRKMPIVSERSSLAAAIWSFATAR